MSKPLICLDFDGVLHSYTSGWQRADVVLDPPVAGMASFLELLSAHFKIAVYSSRSHQPGGIAAMQNWLQNALKLKFGDLPYWYKDIEWPTEKPAAHVSIDDRALTFTGRWPSIDELRRFKPWNKR